MQNDFPELPSAIKWFQRDSEIMKRKQKFQSLTSFSNRSPISRQQESPSAIADFTFSDNRST